MNTEQLCREITDFVSGETTCFDGPNGMVGCNLPITYPDGDNVTVYVGQRDDVWEVSDRGEAYRVVLGRRTVEIKDFTKRVQPICQSLGVVFADGRVLSAARDDSLVTQIWAVGSAAARLSEYVSFLKPPKIVGKPSALIEASFADEVAVELGNRRVELDRDVPVVGASGHRYKAVLFIPSREAVVEPLQPTAPFGNVSTTYAKFGDLQRANGYACFAVIDDRTGEPTADIVRLLKQVGKVVEWTEREPWLVELMR